MLKRMICVVGYLAMLAIVGCADEKVSLVKETKNGKEILVLQKDITELRFSKPDYVQQLDGLGQLVNLRRVVFDMTAFVKNFDFLTQNANIEEVVLVAVSIPDFDFLKGLPNLKSLVIRSARLGKTEIDLHDNKRIQYLEITYSNLYVFPRIDNIPDTLDYINLSHNHIEHIPATYGFRNAAILLFRNPITSSEIPNAVFGDPRKILPDHFKVSDVSS